MGELYANNFVTLLSAAVLAGDVTIPVDAAAPAALQGGQSRFVIDSELILVTAGETTTTWTVTRGVEGTTAAAHADGAHVTHVLTAANLLLASGAFDVRAFGTVDVTGATESTTAVQAAFDAAAPSGEVILPPGTLLVGTINYKGQSIRGAGMYASILLGKASQDVLHADPTAGNSVGSHWRDFTIRVNDSVDASASFPQRGGVGNAGFAVDLADGTSASALALQYADVSNINFEGLSGTQQNASCGIFQQGITFNLSRFRNVRFYRLAYGFWDSYPTSNLTSVELFRDHNHFDSLYFNGCGRGWRLVNATGGQVTNLVMHSNTYALELLGVQSLARAVCGNLDFSNVYLEASDVSFATTNTQDCVFSNVYIAGNAAETVVEFNIDRSKVDGLFIAINTQAVPVLRLTGDRNTFSRLLLLGNGVDPFQWDLIDDQGVGNVVEVAGYWGGAGGRVRRPVSGTPDNRVLHSRDALPGLLGHVDPMPVGFGDLLINPQSIVPTEPNTGEGVGWERLADATADFGYTFRVLEAGAVWSADIGMSADGGFLVGSSFPRARCRIYIKAKLGTGGTQPLSLIENFNLAGERTLGAATVTWGTGYTIQHFDADLTGATLGAGVSLRGQAISGGGAAPLDIAWVMVRPFFHDIFSDGNIEVASAHGGVTLKSPDGTRYVAKIANGGTLTISAVSDYTDAVIAKGPVGCLRLGEATGVDAMAEVGADGTYVNAPTLGASGLLTGDSGTAVTFDAASTQRVNLGTVDALNIAGDFTIIGWIRLPSGGGGRMLSRRPDTVGVEVSLADYHAGGDVSVWISDGTTTVSDSIVQAFPNDSLSHMVAVTRSGSVLQGYRDGVPSYTLSAGAIGSTASATETWIGGSPAYGGLGYLTGTVGEIAIWDRTLPSAEIAELYALGRGI